jgi:hypothetical protein
MLRPPRDPEEAMRKAEQMFKFARVVFLLNLGALAFTLTLIALLRLHGRG